MKEFEFIDYLHNNSTVYDEGKFDEPFTADLGEALYSVQIQTPYLKSFHVERKHPIFEKLLKKGVRVCLYIQEPIESWKRNQLLKDVVPLQEIGVHINIWPGKHQKVAVFDGRILWDGSLNIMSYNTTWHKDRMTRITSPHMAQLAIGQLGLENCDNCIELRKANVIGPCMYMVEVATLGRVVKQKRVELGITQNQLAARIGVHSTIIARIEAGTSIPQLPTFLALCKVFGDSLITVPTNTLPQVDQLTMTMPKIIFPNTQIAS
jgi:Predicted transcriptional regulator with C-terminal CBS domains